jgi:hypothetical protein
VTDDYTGGMERHDLLEKLENGFFGDQMGDPTDELTPDELMLIAHLVMTGKSQEFAEKAWIN